MVQNLKQVYAVFNPDFVDYASMDAVAAYEHQNAKNMLKNRTLKDYEPQLGFELDALGPSTSTSGAVDLGFTISQSVNDSIPFFLSQMNQFTQNVDATSGSDGATAALGLRFLPTLKTFPAQGSENTDIPSLIVPAFLTFGEHRSSQAIGEKIMLIGVVPVTDYFRIYSSFLVLHHICGDEPRPREGAGPEVAPPKHGHQALNILPVPVCH